MSTKSSRGWPFIKGLAKLVSIPADAMAPGSGAALRYLADLQDDLDKRPVETKDGLKEALGEIRANPAQIARLLQAEQITVESSKLSAAAGELAEALYLWQVAKDFLYADFKGIEQQERVASLQLDDIFVDLKAVPEFAGSARFKSRSSSRRGLRDPADSVRPLSERDDGETSASDHDIGLHGLKFSAGGPVEGDLEDWEELESTKDTRSGPLPLDRILSGTGGTVLLGGPGSGKTTLVKRLARSCALGAEECKRRYPQMPWCFPVILPLTTFQTERKERPIFQFIQDHLTALGGEILGDVFREHWAAGQCLVLLDGLDELADSTGRIQAARAVDDLLLSVAGNRVVVTSRIIGYNVTRLSVPAEHYILEPFSSDEIAKFVRQWYLAHDRALHPDHPDPIQAAKDAESLIQDIQKNPGVGTLATNPLMLTIIALIKHANVVLPERRVELYEIALNTLLRSWNRARSLSKTAPVGEEPKLERTKKLWAAVAYWMHSHVSRTISEKNLHDQLVRVLTEDFQHPPHEADDIASSYLDVARDRCGLLEARGPRTFAFVHQSFQEYLAAIHLAIPSHKAVAKIRRHAHDPRWHEAIRLAAGYIAVHQSDFETLSSLMQSFLDSDDPLEPYLGTSLRLAMACQSDELGVRTTDSDRMLEKVFQHLAGAGYDPLRQSLLDSLSSLRVIPGPHAIELLCKATRSASWRTRMEAARLLGRVQGPHESAVSALQNLLNVDSDPDVKAHAAWGLWQANQRRDHDLVRNIVYGLSNGPARMKLGPQPEMLLALLALLQDADSYVRSRAASVLGGWGHQEQALPALLALLQDADSYVRSRAVSVLGGWGHQEQALPALLALLQDADSSVRYRAAEVLRGWGHQEQALPALLALLQDADSDVRSLAASVLGGWGPQEQALPALLALLQDASSDVRYRAASVLGGWGHQEQALPALLALLQDASGSIRYLAAEVLRGWGPQEQALPALLALLQDASSDVRYRAASVLGGWGPQEQALPALLALLQDASSDVRYRAASVLGGWGHQEQALPALLALLQDASSSVRSGAASVLGGWGHQEQALPALLALLQDADSDVRSRAAEVLRGWGKSSAVVRAVAARFYRGKADAESVVQYLVTAAQGGSKQRSEEINTLLAKALKQNARDSVEKSLLRKILFQWVWNALATTA